MQWKGVIPNFFTMANLCCGTLAIVSLFTVPSFTPAALLILAAAVFDLFDGLLARMLKVAGPLGKQLDSLADAVTFGIAPTIMVFILLSRVLAQTGYPDQLKYVALLLAIASIYRLGKFNIDSRQGDKFLGLPTPANALFWIAVGQLYFHSDPLFITTHPALEETGWQALKLGSWDAHLLETRPAYLLWVFHPLTLIALIVGMSAWMVSEIPLLALKFKDYGWHGNRSRYFFILGTIILLTICGISAVSVFLAVPFILLLYLLISLWNQHTTKKHEIPRRD
jgi:CDP-diacylglycerol---serine O-phosphatidyltransferase